MSSAPRRPNPATPMSRPSRVAIFGGTFDPIHLGHLEIANKARTALQLDRVIFLPCRQSPHKSSAPGASDEQRLEMIQLVSKDYPWAEVSDHELSQAPPSYTWESVRHFKSTLPESTRLFLILGLDQWTSLPTWAHPERIARDVELIVVGRNGTPSPREGYQAHFLPGNHPASSSEIRSALASGEDPKWLPGKIRTFLSENGLYSDIA